MSAATPFRPLRRRLLARVGRLALACCVLVMALEAVGIYRQVSSDFQAMVERIGRNQVPPLTQALWDLEERPLRHQVALVADRPEVAWAELESSTGLRVSAGSRDPAQPVDAVLSVPHPLDAAQTLGVLSIQADRGYRRGLLWRAVGYRALEVLLITGTLALLIGMFLRRELDRPLRRLAGYVADLSPARPGTPRSLGRRPRPWHDEIDLVFKGFETLSESIHRYVAQRDEAMAQLSAERDQLDRRVEQRTADLQRMNSYLDFLSRTLMRCVHLPVAGYREGLRQALEELAERTGATACGLARRDGQDRWVWQVIWRDEARCRAFGEEGGALRHEWEGCGWLADPGCPDFRGYRLDEAGGGNLLLLGGAPWPADDDELRYQKMAAEMLFSLVERWQHAAQLELTRAELERLSRSDPLTGLANRRHFDEHWHNELRRADRSGQPLAVLMLDVDHFKAYNDRYGHMAGDRCLAAVGQCLREHFQRAGELPARLGGEEFAVLLPGCDADDARHAAERLRQAILALEIEHLGSPLRRLTVSIGYAACAADVAARRTPHLLDEADRALYGAKSGGRNQVRGALREE